MEYIAFDSHKRYTFASVEEHTGNVLRTGRINHCRGAISEFLSAWKPGTEVAVETTGNWYWCRCPQYFVRESRTIVNQIPAAFSFFPNSHLSFSIPVFQQEVVSAGIPHSLDWLPLNH